MSNMAKTIQSGFAAYHRAKARDRALIIIALDRRALGDARPDDRLRKVMGHALWMDMLLAETRLHADPSISLFQAAQKTIEDVQAYLDQVQLPRLELGMPPAEIYRWAWVGVREGRPCLRWARQ